MFPEVQGRPPIRSMATWLSHRPRQGEDEGDISGPARGDRLRHVRLPQRKSEEKPFFQAERDCKALTERQEVLRKLARRRRHPARGPHCLSLPEEIASRAEEAHRQGGKRPSPRRNRSRLKIMDQREMVSEPSFPELRTWGRKLRGETRFVWWSVFKPSRIMDFPTRESTNLGVLSGYAFPRTSLVSSSWSQRFNRQAPQETKPPIHSHFSCTTNRDTAACRGSSARPKPFTHAEPSTACPTRRPPHAPAFHSPRQLSMLDSRHGVAHVVPYPNRIGHQWRSRPRIENRYQRHRDDASQLVKQKGSMPHRALRPTCAPRRPS